MGNKRFTSLAVAAILLLATGRMSAHHSEAIYDMEKQITLEGTVTDFKFVNPHPHVYFQAKDEAGNVVEWIAESGRTRHSWYNVGRRANFLQPGDQITITGSPANDGRTILRIREIVNPSGQEWTEGD